MDPSVLEALAPVVLLIMLGVLGSRRGWIGLAATRDLSNLVFFLLLPGLLFRAMGSVDLAHLRLAPVFAFLLAAGSIFFCTLLVRGFNPQAAVLGVAAIYGNVVMIGIPLVGLVWGRAGLVPLLTLISLHGLSLLITATVVIELALAHVAARPADQPRRPIAATVLIALRNAVLHPVPLPIIAGLLFAQTGWTLPAPIDKTLQLLGQAFGPIALVLVGATLGHTRIGSRLTGALWLTAIKNLLMPLLVFGFGRLLGLDGLPLTVMITAAAMPSGANVFLFAQRYRVAEELSTATVAVSTAAALVTVSIVLALVGRV